MRKSRRYWYCIALMLFLLLVAAYYVGGRAAETAKPWVWNRNGNTAERQNTGLHITANAGFTTSSINTASASTSSCSENARLDFSSVAVRADSEHPLALACAEKIAEKLKTIPLIQRIMFAPPDPIIGKEELLPSQFVRVEVNNLNERFALNRSLTGDVNITFGVSASRPPCEYGDGEAPPLVHFNNTATHNIRFTHTGISTQSAFYSKIADDIALRTVKAIMETIEKLSETSSFLPRMPEAFYPAYCEASDIPPIPGLVSTTTIIDGRRFMLPHYSLVQIDSNFEGTGSEFLTAVQDSMNEAGWDGKAQQHEGGAAYIRLTRGTETFYLFKEQRNQDLRLESSMLNVEQKQLPNNEPPHIFLLERTEKMPQDSVLSAIQTLLDENASPSLLLMFTHRLYGNSAAVKELKEQIRERLLNWQTGTPAEQLSLVQFFNREEDKEIAREMLLKAWRVRQLTWNPPPDSDYMKLAEDLGIEEELKAQPPPTPELCEEYGFTLLTPENCPMEADIELEKEAQFATFNEEGYLSFIRFTLRHENGVYQTEVMQKTFMELQKTFMEHGSSYSTINFSGGNCNIAASLPRGNGEHFTFSVVEETLPVMRVRVRAEFRER